MLWGLKGGSEAPSWALNCLDGSSCKILGNPQPPIIVDPRPNLRAPNRTFKLTRIEFSDILYLVSSD